ncbi:hypothetical protein [Nocardioides sp. URHA0032]|uniref:hypothetical protein n=1 Tax=Nocardioides sp. URHA0032 TaxID=1380388 RepID=UPI00048D2036|nr:hypothetical protein [Nocardioides sp. URHA0032]
MSHSETLLLAATVGGFLLLGLTVGAFVISRPRLGVLLLVLSGVAFVAALVLMGRVSSQWEVEKRQAVLAKYDVKVQAWGAPLGSATQWKVDGKNTECVVILTGADAPVMTCDGQEMPLRG